MLCYQLCHLTFNMFLMLRYTLRLLTFHFYLMLRYELLKRIMVECLPSKKTNSLGPFEKQQNECFYQWN